jgi:hypothetical protein
LRDNVWSSRKTSDNAERKLDSLPRKKIPAMRMQVFEKGNSVTLVCAIAAMIVLLVRPELLDARKPPLSDTNIAYGKTAAGFCYMEGGFAFDDQQAMERHAGRYNLKLVFAPRLGASRTEVMLLIGNNQSRKVDKILLRGPWLYVQLPLGVYTLMARIKNEVVLIRDIHLEESRRTIHFAYGK